MWKQFPKRNRTSKRGESDKSDSSFNVRNIYNLKKRNKILKSDKKYIAFSNEKE